MKQTSTKKRVPAKRAPAPKKVKQQASATAAAEVMEAPVVPEEVNSIWVNIDQVVSSPFNYRFIFRQETLEELAQSMRQDGILSPLVVRMDGLRYEVVSGERRLRAARLAGLKRIPVIVKDYTDEQAREIQLVENSQREDTHPMEDAHRVGFMEEAGQSVEEIAKRLGKSKSFVYARLQLLKLIYEIQEVVVEDKIRMITAMEIAHLPADAQYALFSDQLTDWKEQSGMIEIQQLDQYRYDLHRTNFDTTDATLVPEQGACTGCQFNSATAGLLFPELSRSASCYNKSCYQQKTKAHFTRLLADFYAANQPVALLIRGQLTVMQKEVVTSLDEINQLPQHDWYRVYRNEPPELPDKEEYRLDWGWDEEAEDSEEDSEPKEEDQAGSKQEYDEENYAEALQEYEEELAAYQEALQANDILKGLCIAGGEVSLVHFTLHQQQMTSGNSEVRATAKEVRQAISRSTATPEMLEGEISRLQQRERRNLELDREKLHKEIYDKVCGWMETPAPDMAIEEIDEIAIRFLVFEALEWSDKNSVREMIRRDRKKTEEDQEDIRYSYGIPREELMDTLKNLTTFQWTMMVRMALLHKAEAGYPHSNRSVFVRPYAEAMCMDLEILESISQSKAITRKLRVDEKVEELEKKAAKLRARLGAGIPEDMETPSEPTDADAVPAEAELITNE